MNPNRPAADRERDATSRPAELMSFLGVRRGIRVFDLNAATGYFTELLANVVGPRGHVIAHNHPGALTMLGERIKQRYDHGRLPNVEQLLARHDDLRLAPASLDLVLMSMTYHDTYWYDAKVDWGPVEQCAFLQQFYTAIKPGGVVGVIDHVAPTDMEPRTSAMKLHRIDPAIVKRDFERAGFVLESESNVVRNPNDDHSLGVFDPAIHNHTDRFIMRFRRPPG
ncbi:MAG: methyltransferase [Gammaproteobacteria bacterium]